MNHFIQFYYLTFFIVLEQMSLSLVCATVAWGFWNIIIVNYFSFSKQAYLSFLCFFIGLFILIEHMPKVFPFTEVGSLADSTGEKMIVWFFANLFASGVYVMIGWVLLLSSLFNSMIAPYRESYRVSFFNIWFFGFACAFINALECSNLLSAFNNLFPDGEMLYGILTMGFYILILQILPAFLLFYGFCLNYRKWIVQRNFRISTVAALLFFVMIIAKEVAVFSAA
ncbi:MAG: hypothetical protein CMO81_02165 [Waddliaceae bacterium]|nr:hypothetical protein [Waddliaceae bacterium]